MLWDPTYVDESWINEPVKLIPRMKEWVAQSYPGLATSIGEGNFGGENHMSGALAIAEALGRFAQAGVQYAYYWTYPPEGSPAMFGFHAFRDFDGKAGHFLDWFTPSTVAGSPATTAFVSRDDAGKHLVLVLLNQSRKDALAAEVDLGACGHVTSVQGYAYDGGHDGFKPRAATSAGGKVTEALAPYSITVLDVALAGSVAPSH